MSLPTIKSMKTKVKEIRGDYAEEILTRYKRYKDIVTILNGTRDDSAAIKRLKIAGYKNESGMVLKKGLDWSIENYTAFAISHKEEIDSMHESYVDATPVDGYSAIGDETGFQRARMIELNDRQ